jgi:hypothetical protein
MRKAAAVILLFAAAASCSRSPPPADDPQLRKAEAVARHLTSARHLNRSTYTATRQSGTPSELVGFLFSDLGVAEWPPGESDSAGEREQAKASRVPLIPSDVALVARQPDPRAKRQLVLKADDAKRELIAEGYADPAKPPVFVERWAMPEVKGR